MARTSQGCLTDSTCGPSTAASCATTESLVLLRQWNATSADYPRESCVHQLVEAQVERTPETSAVVFQDQALTYRALNERANQLAQYLQERGVGPEVPVGLCVARSLELAVAVLGVLKAGGAYVPLDVSYPDDRLAFMLADTAGPVLLTQKSLLPRLPASQAAVVCLDTEAAAIGRMATTNPPKRVQAENLAYIIYTSGSTGKPKGIAMPHRPLVNLLCWQMTQGQQHGMNRTLQFAPLSFDVSFQEMFSTWCAGGTLLLIPEGLRRDPVALVQFLSEQSVDRIFLPYVALQQLADVVHNQAVTLPTLREVITAGEQLKITRSLARFFEEHPACTLQNQYGPSESHVVTAYTLPGSPRTWPALPSIGRPIANTQMYVLNAEREPVPPGEVGELYIGGDGVARGYWKRPDLTAERFLLDPFRTQPQACLYRTGDLARYLPDGNLEFVGRRDHQVKIRGFRIELAEIETILSQHPAVRTAVVLRREDVPGEARLVAYLVIGKKPAPTLTEVRRFVQGRLPEYMVPSAMVLLKALPLTPSGKVDRQALPPPGQERPPLEQPFVEPRNELERQLQQIWQAVLHVRPIGVNDPFSELGGDSLQAAHLFLQIQKVLGKCVPLWPPLHDVTIEHLADLLHRPVHTPAGSALVPIRAGTHRPPLFLVHGIGGELVTYSHLVENLPTEQPVYGFQRVLAENEDPTVPLSVEAMAAGYLEELLGQPFTGPFHLVGYSFGGIVALEMAQQLLAKGQEVALLVLIDEPYPDPQVPHFGRLHLLRCFFQNLPYWLWDEFLPRSPQQHYRRFAKKLRRLKERLLQRLTGVPTQLPEEDVSELFTLSRISEEFRAICERNYRALKGYRAQPYPRRITLFRGRTQPLFCPYGADLGWSKVAAGGLTIKVIPGAHVSLLKEPHVSVLARALQAALDQA